MKMLNVLVAGVLAGVLLVPVCGCNRGPSLSEIEAKERTSRLFRDAMDDLQAGRMDAAIKRFERVVQEEPKAYSAHFQLATLLQDVKRMKFDHLGAFAFSPEEGTPAAEMKGRPSRAVAERREREVMSAQRRVWSAKAKTFVGKTLRALVVAPRVARLESQAPDVDGVVLLKRARPVGTFTKVKIAAVRGFDFEA